MAGEPPERDTSLYKDILDNAFEGVYFVDRDRRITYWNSGAERLTGYEASEVVGRMCNDNLLMHTDEEGQGLCAPETCPASRAMAASEALEAEAYFHHKDGHRVPIVTRTTPICDADGDVIGAVEVFSDNSARIADRQRIEELQQLALLDPLTGIGNRQHAEIHIRGRLDELRRYGWRFGLLFFDVDRFKSVNDSFGHDTGDEVLRAVALTARGGVRSFDLVSRWGGEEFTAIVANVDEPRLRAIADKLRRLVSQSPVPAGEGMISVTVSVGATIARVEDSVESLVERADRLMYSSKERGRDLVTLG